MSLIGKKYEKALGFKEKANTLCMVNIMDMK